MVQKTSGKQWSVNKKFPLLWYQWETEYVVYHPGTGDTHHFDELSALLLQIIEHNRFNTNELAIEFSAKTCLEMGDDLFVYIERSISRFQRLNLIIQAI